MMAPNLMATLAELKFETCGAVPRERLHRHSDYASGRPSAGPGSQTPADELSNKALLRGRLDPIRLPVNAD